MLGSRGATRSASHQCPPERIDAESGEDDDDRFRDGPESHVAVAVYRHEHRDREWGEQRPERLGAAPMQRNRADERERHEQRVRDESGFARVERAALGYFE